MSPSGRVLACNCRVAGEERADRPLTQVSRAEARLGRIQAICAKHSLRIRAKHSPACTKRTTAQSAHRLPRHLSEACHCRMVSNASIASKIPGTDPSGTRTRNLRVRDDSAYPLRHKRRRDGLRASASAAAGDWHSAALGGIRVGRSCNRRTDCRAVRCVPSLSAPDFRIDPA
jgi:hypothetical protein